MAKELKEKGANLNPDVDTTPSPLACKMAAKSVEEAKLAVTTEGVKLFEVYGNLLSDEARQPWEKILQAQVAHSLPRLPPRLETPSVNELCFTFNRCFNSTQTKCSSSISQIC